MPIINGRYYMNPQYGLAVERARAADEEHRRLHGEPKPSWLDHFLGLVPTPQEQERIHTRNIPPSDIFDQLNHSGHEYAVAYQSHQAGAQSPRPPADNTTVGNSVYNETSGLRPTSPAGPGSAQDLSKARAGIAGVTKNRAAAGKGVGTGTAPGRLSNSEDNAVKTYPPAKTAYEDSQAAASGAPGDSNGPQGFYLDYGQRKPPWVEGKEPVESYGPFRNASGHGDVPKGANVRIRIYH